jgi:hypothetical protein
MQLILKNVNSFAFGMYLFFGVLLLQNIVVLPFLATGLAFPISLVYAIKYVLLAAVGCLLLVTRDFYRTLWADKPVMAVLGAVLLLAAVRGGGFGYMAEELRFYLTPAAFYLIGKAAGPFHDERQIGRFVVFVALFYVAIGLLFIVVDRRFLMDFGLRSFFHQKLPEIGRGDETYNGMPTNFFYFGNEGRVFYRAFGAFFDPLVTAYFGASLFFFLYETHRRKLVRYAGVLTVFVGLLLMLTMTRAIIMGVAFVVVLSITRRKGIAALPVWLALVVGGVALAAAILNFASLLSLLDPSSVAHLNAYRNISITTGLIGSPPDPDAPRGAESLYLTILMELGVGVLAVFVIWFASIYRKLLRGYELPYMRPTLESMFVYLLASFTTEHWFVFTSGSIFWFLLGNVLRNAERNAPQKRARSTEVFPPAATPAHDAPGRA